VCTVINNNDNDNIDKEIQCDVNIQEFCSCEWGTEPEAIRLFLSLSIFTARVAHLIITASWPVANLELTATCCVKLRLSLCFQIQT